ncbi:ulp1 protease family protein [Colletotrichum tofieldiae]|nr:ulp1 protease family protein [Colletotrichum tofieldiae]
MHTLKSLAPGQQLNDLAINLVIHRLASRDPVVGVFDSLTVSAALRNPDARWCKGAFERLGRKTSVFIPIHINQHWVLFQYRTSGDTLYFDSFLSLGLKEAATDLLFRFLDAVTISPRQSRSVPTSQKCEQQTNSVDCGVHVLRNTECAIAQGLGRPTPVSANLVLSRKYYASICILPSYIPGDGFHDTSAPVCHRHLITYLSDVKSPTSTAFLRPFAQDVQARLGRLLAQRSKTELEIAAASRNLALLHMRHLGNYLLAMQTKSEAEGTKEDFTALDGCVSQVLQGLGKLMPRLGPAKPQQALVVDPDFATVMESLRSSSVLAQSYLHRHPPRVDPGLWLHVRVTLILVARAAASLEEKRASHVSANKEYMKTLIDAAGAA